VARDPARRAQLDGLEDSPYRSLHSDASSGWTNPSRFEAVHDGDVIELHKNSSSCSFCRAAPVGKLSSARPIKPNLGCESFSRAEAQVEHPFAGANDFVEK